MSLISSMSMFYLSFTPLWISVLFLDVKSIVVNNSNLYTEWISIALITFWWLLSFISFRISVNTRKRNGVLKYRLVSVEVQKTITSEYLLSYILPLFAFDFTVWSQVVLFLIYFLTLGYLCVKNNHLSVNIVLELFHYCFYKCDLETDDKIVISKYIISKEKLLNHKNQIISTRPLNNEYSLDLMGWENNN